MGAAGCIGAVLAGGSSRRMGVDKAFIEIDGAAMVERAVAALRAAGAAGVVVVGGDAARLCALGLTSVPDRYPGQGPLGAVITALHALDSLGGPGLEAVVTHPCDVIAADPSAARAVIDGLAGAGPAADAAVPLAEGAAQWLHAAWRRRCGPVLRSAFDRGVRAPTEAAECLVAVPVEAGGPGWFRDADRPEDLPPTVRGGGTSPPVRGSAAARP